MPTHRGHWLLLVVAALAACQCSRRGSATPTPTPPDAAAALQVAVEAKKSPFAEDDERSHQVWKEEQRFYKQNGYQLVWSDGKRAGVQVNGLIRAIRAADQEGLEPADYHVDELDAARRSSLDRSQAIQIDLRATYVYLRYAWDLTHGTIDPEDIEPQWHATPRNVDLHNALQTGLGENRVEQSLQALAPMSPQYQGLKHQLALGRAKGDAALVQQIVMNMERWRWLPEDLGSRYVLVNIPAFRLDVIEDGKSVLGTKVVTGNKGNRTPVMADRMTYVVFSPYWNIPPDIVKKEIAPKVDKDPGYLERNHIEVDADGGRYRQRPGPGNSLGLVKFVFPNHFNVYLHDTPAQALFNRIERDFSHGCVRLEQPMDLAKYVLRDQPEWSEEKISAAMHAGTERTVTLRQPLPVYLVYFTAWEENGSLRTVPDVYGYDRRHNAAASAQ
jgi:murein L,D-transpeptidase YcbB/YkuD